ncbi:hypothetical protein CEXT_555271 [Caerostris extrusa]|uniref:Uncharacterized protein n=1 Tax=Caerostris extrusa TaxID=172846 RepID=A0AAV4N8S2_CAEEX|nr:hypothetical protein CEXT_555271 [Caerostris extrusa]
MVYDAWEWGMEEEKELSSDPLKGTHSERRLCLGVETKPLQRGYSLSVNDRTCSSWEANFYLVGQADAQKLS